MSGIPGHGGRKGRSGRKSHGLEQKFIELKKLSLERAICQLKRDENKAENQEEKERLEDRKDSITLKVLDKIIPQQIKLGEGNGEDMSIVLVRFDANKS